jgi:hypothetical protein
MKIALRGLVMLVFMIVATNGFGFSAPAPSPGPVPTSPGVSA